MIVHEVMMLKNNDQDYYERELLGEGGAVPYALS